VILAMILVTTGGALALSGAPARAQSPFATAVSDFSPAPGQFVNDPLFSDSAAALGRPYAGGFEDPGNSSLVSLGGFGGSITLAFDHTVLDDAANPFGLDAIVFGNAFWVASDPNRRWAEAGVIEISRDVNGNGVADDPWYLIPGSHVVDPVNQYTTQTWDDDWADPTWAPDDPDWVPPGCSGIWQTGGWLLPAGIFANYVVVNPNGLGATLEGYWGYADCTPTLRLGDLNGDNVIDDPNAVAEVFYTRPDNPLVVGLTPGSAGGDAFDIAWAVDEVTGAPAQLEGFDFVRISTGVNYIPANTALGEISTEVDAVADVAMGRLGDSENDGDIDLADLVLMVGCWHGPDAAAPTCPCRVMDFDQNGALDLRDFAAFQVVFGS